MYQSVGSKMLKTNCPASCHLETDVPVNTEWNFNDFPTAEGSASTRNGLTMDFITCLIMHFPFAEYRWWCRQLPGTWADLQLLAVMVNRALKEVLLNAKWFVQTKAKELNLSFIHAYQELFSQKQNNLLEMINWNIVDSSTRNHSFEKSGLKAYKLRQHSLCGVKYKWLCPALYHL